MAILMNFKDIINLISNDFEAVNTYIVKNLHSNIALAEEIGHYIISSGGKRIRPVVTLLAANACNYQGSNHINTAAIIEFLHTATLLHDDVVDDSNLRRGKASANSVWGNPASVLVGDFLISRSFQMVVGMRDLRLMDILASCTNIISEGEILQLTNCRNPDTSEASYMDVIYAKTAKMFEAAAEAGSVLASDDPATKEQLIMQKAMKEYAKQLGIAFQLIDDLLDYQGDAEEMGKNVGDDLAEGKPTLPLIYAIENASAEEASLIRDAIKTGGLDKLDAVISIVKNCGGLTYTQEKAEAASQLAIEALAPIANSSYKEGLIALADLAVNRSN